ncbi:MAG: hypothetical protein IT459_15755 [Planctomycetes bacterium]|nr:hypothetical protein [Planctomycetota bacterium]
MDSATANHALANLLLTLGATEFVKLAARDTYARLKARTAALLRWTATQLENATPEELAAELAAKQAITDPELRAMLAQLASEVSLERGVAIRNVVGVGITIEGLRTGGRSVSIDGVRAAADVTLRDIDLR